ncbi:MAG: hypothetical protein NT062_04505 [Proteobacteria bacterium]|nr:hypothetical protein [Pseudomonadota bacterium]
MGAGVRWLLVGHLLFVMGCLASEERPPQAFELIVRVTIPAQITSVTADGTPQLLEVDGTGAALVFHQRYGSYADALKAPTIRFEFWADQTSQFVGEARSGACTRCPAESCPSRDELEKETVQFAISNFTPTDVSCFSCEGGGHLVFSCPLATPDRRGLIGDGGTGVGGAPSSVRGF